MNIDKQSDLSWRKRRFNSENSENFPGFSHIKQARRSSGTFFITLAKESPPRVYDSETSVYDSFHGLETDICRDTSDTESNTTEEIATMDVHEYEVASTSASEDLYSHDSSSGTDDFVAAAVARAIFDESSSSDQFEILADTEESDGPTDPELGLADYWTCVKCKNRQNNPMYRYCEKCYQIRKTHFPPRPKMRKTRSRYGKRSSSTLRGGMSPSSDEKERRLGHVNGNLLTNSKSKRVQNNAKKANSAGESSATDDNDDDSVEKCDINITSVYKKDIRLENNLKSLASVVYEKDVRVETTLTSSNFKIKNKLLTNLIDKQPADLATTSDTKLRLPSELALIKNTNKDSGFSSCGSSQELFPDTATDKSIVESLSCISSQETICSDFEPIANKHDRLHSNYLSNSESILPNTESFSQNDIITDSLTRSETTLSENSTGTVASVMCSLSSCSEQLSRNYDLNLPEINSRRSLSDTEIPSSPQNSKTFDAVDSAYGMCIMCLAQPKNGVFVHSRFLHLCCCYRCAVKVWNKRKRCPICNCKVKNVMKLFVH